MGGAAGGGGSGCIAAGCAGACPGTGVVVLIVRLGKYSSMCNRLLESIGV